jgi:RND family efflux transporter MFP subunit
MMETKTADLSALKIKRSVPDEGRSFKPKIKFLIGMLTTFLIVIAGILLIQSLLFSPVVSVRLVTVSWTSPSQSNASLNASGYVVAQRKASVASKGTGRLVYLGVVEGDKVKKDQVIARLEDTDIIAALEQARANLRMYEADLYEAEMTLNRTKSLHEKNLASQAEYDAADARVKRLRASIDVAKAGITAAEVALENTRIRAPFDGTVLTKNADVGEIVAPLAASASSRAAVVTIADMSSLQVEADVSESNIERISVNQNCEISLDAYPEKRYAGYVAKVVPTADRAKATVLVKVAFISYDSRVLPEMSAKVLFLSKPPDPSNADGKPLLTVPATAIVDRNGKKVAFRVADNRAVSVTVTTGTIIGSSVEIRQGLTAGEKVIEKVNDTIIDGVKVKIE